MTVTTGASDIDQAWTAELNRAITLDTNASALFDDKSAQLPHGNVLNMPSRHNATANTKTAGTDLTPEAITEPNQTFTVSTQKACAQEIEDILEIQSKYDLRAETTMANSYALARAMDVDATTLFSTNTTQTVGVLGTELTVDNLLRARQYLKDSAAPMPYYCMVSPATYNGFLKLDVFTNCDYTGDQAGRAINMAQVGKLFSATVYESQLLSGTAPSSSGGFWSKSHYFKIVQRPPATHTWYSPLAVSWIVSMDVIYGMFERLEADEAAAATTNSKLWGVRLQSAK